MKLRPAGEVAEAAHDAVERFRREAAPLLEGAEVHHIGATAFGAGLTKGDVDVNVRVEPERFEQVVVALRARYEVAQPQNWTSTFASFATGELGVQVTAIGSPDDYLLYLRDLLAADPELRERYDAVKAEAAAGGPDAYWRAKDAFLRALLAERPPLT